jgi:hypothetical protein
VVRNRLGQLDLRDELLLDERRWIADLGFHSKTEHRYKYSETEREGDPHLSHMPIPFRLGGGGEAPAKCTEHTADVFACQQLIEAENAVNRPCRASTAFGGN